MSEKQAGPLFLPAIDPYDVPAVHLALSLWVEHLVERLQLGSEIVLPCWNRHAPMAEALQALKDLERGCFLAKDAPPGAGVDWLRGLAFVSEKLRELVKQSGCSGHVHADKKRPSWTTDAAGWPAIPPPEDDILLVDV